MHDYTASPEQSQIVGHRWQWVPPLPVRDKDLDPVPDDGEECFVVFSDLAFGAEFPHVVANRLWELTGDETKVVLAVSLLSGLYRQSRDYDYAKAIGNVAGIENLDTVRSLVSDLSDVGILRTMTGWDGLFRVAVAESGE